jgi:nucleotide-binding universal stress UspA family protein
MKNKIIVPTDLTKAADQAIKQAVVFAVATKSSLTLLHVLDGKSPSKEESEMQLSNIAAGILAQNGIHCEIMIREGSIFDVIPDVTREHDYDLMVIATHGMKGIKQMFFGSNILKLIAKVFIPVLVVQEGSPLIGPINKIVIPVSSHNTFIDAVYAVLMIAGTYNPEVHLYSIHKPGFDWPEQMFTNIENATQIFNSGNVRMIRVKEDQNVFSLGYAKQTLKYAHSVGADLICMMSASSKEYYYFAPSDKETMVLNEYHLPILCAGGGNGV